MFGYFGTVMPSDEFFDPPVVMFHGQQNGTDRNYAIRLPNGWNDNSYLEKWEIHRSHSGI